jgi:hypothetical protein
MTHVDAAGANAVVVRRDPVRLTSRGWPKASSLCGGVSEGISATTNVSLTLASYMHRRRVKDNGHIMTPRI